MNYYGVSNETMKENRKYQVKYAIGKIFGFIFGVLAVAVFFGYIIGSEWLMNIIF